MEDFVGKLERARSVWLMVPAAVVDSTLDSLIPLLDEGDCVVDGGNSYYRDDIRRRPGSPSARSTTSTPARAAESGGSTAAIA